MRKTSLMVVLTISAGFLVGCATPQVITSSETGISIGIKNAGMTTS